MIMIISIIKHQKSVGKNIRIYRSVHRPFRPIALHFFLGLSLFRFPAGFFHLIPFINLLKIFSILARWPNHCCRRNNILGTFRKLVIFQTNRLPFKTYITTNLLARMEPRSHDKKLFALACRHDSNMFFILHIVGARSQVKAFRLIANFHLRNVKKSFLVSTGYQVLLGLSPENSNLLCQSRFLNS